MKTRRRSEVMIASFLTFGLVLPFLNTQKKASHPGAEKERPLGFGEVIDHANHGVCAIVRVDNQLGFGVPIVFGFFVIQSVDGIRDSTFRLVLVVRLFLVWLVAEGDVSIECSSEVS